MPARRQRRWMAVAAAAAVAACSRSADPDLRLRSIAPAQATQGTAVAIRIEGDGVAPHVFTDYGDRGDSVVDARFQAWLGPSRLRDVRPSGDGALLAVVPEDLVAGTYDLVVADPDGKRATLPGAFRVLSPSDGEALVASFRIDPVGAQVAGAPFAITVTALDASGRPVTAFSGSAAISDRTGALVPGAIGPFAWGAWTGPVEVRAAAAADALTVTDGLGHAGASGAFVVHPAPAARVAFTSPAVDAAAGACAGPVTVALEDLYGAPTAATAAVDVALSGAVEVYADAACAIPSAGATIAPGATTASAFVRSTLAAPFTLDAAAAGLAPAAQPGLVRAAAPARLVFTTPPQTVTAGACSGAAAVRSEDAFGNPSPVPADRAVALSSTAAAGLAFHAAAGCGAAPVGGVLLPAGATAATFWFRATTAETVGVTAAGAGIALSATQAETVVPAAPTSLAFVTASQAVAAGSCSGVATVEARDAFGNAAPVTAPTAVALAAAPAASFAFHLDAACGGAPVVAASLAAGATRASFWFRATATGTYAVTATGAGLATPAAQPETIGPAAPDRLVFTSAAKAAVAGACSGPLAVEVRDGLGNASPLAAATPFALSAAPAAGTVFYATPDCTGPEGGPATIPAGSAAGTFSFRSTRAGTFDATAAVAGLTAATQPQAVAPAAPDRLVFTTAPATIAAGGCSGALAIEARDAYDNVAPVAADTAVALSAAPAAGAELHRASSCGGQPLAEVTIAAGASNASFRFTGTAAGPLNVAAAGAGIPNAASQVATILPAAPDRLVFTTATQTVTAGSCSAGAVVEARDAYGNVAPVSALTAVALSAAPAAGLAFHASAGCGDAPVASVALAAGASSATVWFRGTVAGAPALTASGAGFALAATQAAAIVPAAPARLVVTTAAQTVTAGDCSGAVTVEARDPWDNVAPVAASTAVALAAAPGAGLAFFGSSGCGGAPVGSVDLGTGASTATFWFRGTVAGSPTVTATGAGMATAAAQAETIVPAAPDRLVVTSAPQAVAAGGCSGAVTLEARDVHGNVAPVAALTAVALSATPAAGFAFHDRAGCATAPVSSVGLAAGASGATFWFRGTAAGPVAVAATGAGIAIAAAQAETIDPAPPAGVVFASAPQTVVAGACSGAARLELRDAFGNPTADPGAAIALALSAAPGAGVELFEDDLCAVAVPGASIAVPAGSTGKDFWFRGTVATTETLTSAPAGLAPASQAELVVPAAPARLVFTSPPQAPVAGACAAATVEARDAHDNVAPVSALTAVALAGSPSAGLSFHGAAGCGGGAVGSVEVAAGASGTTFWFRDTVAGAVALTATGAGIALPATQAETIVPAAPDRLVFVSPPQTLSAGECSPAPAALEARDVYGNVAPVSALTAVALSAAPPGGFSFHDQAGCGAAPVASVDVAAGASGTSFWFRGTVTGTPAVTALGAGIPSPAAQTATIVPAAPDRLVFTSAAQTVTAGACSGPVTLEVRDVHGNAAPVAARAPVALSAAPGGGFELFDAPGCAGAPVASVDVAAGDATTTFWFRGTLAGTPAIGAAAAGIPSPATQLETVTPAAPDRLVFTSPPQTVTAGACSGAATVESLDAYGNVAPVAGGAAVSLAANPPAGFAFHGVAGCGAGPVGSVAIAAGATSATFWFRATAAGTVSVTAAGTGIPGATTQQEVVDPAAPASVVFTSPPRTEPAGGCSAAVRVELRDAFGNPTAKPGGDVALAVTAAPGAGLELFEDALCAAPVPGASLAIAAGSVGKDLWFRGTVATPVTLAATPAGLAGASQVETIVPAAAARIRFAAAPLTAVAGVCSAPVTVVSLDAYDNVAPVSGPTAVALDASPATGFELHGGGGCGGAPVGETAIAAGATTATFRFRGTLAGVVTVTASAFATSASQPETVLPAAPDRLGFTSAAQTIVAGECAAATLEARDAFGNVAPVGAPTLVSLSAAPAVGLAFSDAAGCGGTVGSVTLAPGASGTTFWFRPTASGPVTLTASGVGVPNAATQAETVKPATPERLVFASAPQDLTAGACSAVATVEAHDAYGNVAPVAAATPVTLSAVPPGGFAFHDAADCGSAPVATVAIDAGSSSASFRMRGTVSGTVTITASGAGIATAATQGETVAPAVPDRLLFATGVQTVGAGSCSGDVTLEARDVYGNVAPVTALTTVSLAAAPATGFQFFAAAGCAGGAVPSVDLAAGTSARTFSFRGTAAGAVTVTAAGAGIPNGATQGATVTPAAPSRLVFTPATQTVTAGACSAESTVEARDAYGNPSPVAAPTAVTLSAAPAAGFAFHDSAGCGSAAVGAVTLATGQTTTSVWVRGTAAGAVAVTAAGAGIATSASQAVTVAPAATDRFAFDPVTTPWIRAWPYALRVRALDAFGNATPAFGGTAALAVAVPVPPNGAGATLTCTSGCGSGTVTAPFVGGVWTGQVSVAWADPDPQKVGAIVRATGSGAWSAVAGATSALDVIGAVRSPPAARVAADPVVVYAGQPVTFDASGSTDYQTAAASLQVSWDLLGASTAPPPGAPWTAWSTAKTASNVYSAPGTYTARVAVRDADGDVGYGRVTVVVLLATDRRCVVTTSADVDDGATAGSGASPCDGPSRGTDGELSLPEAIRLAPSLTWITFAAPMTITGTGAYTIARDDVTIAAPAGTVISGRSFQLSGNRAKLVGLELANQTTPITTLDKKNLTVEDCYLHDMPGIAALATLTMDRVRMERCVGSCVASLDATGNDPLTIRHSTFVGGSGAVGVDLPQCKGGKVALVAQSNVFAGLQTAIRYPGSGCTSLARLWNNTFAGNGTGVSYPAVASANHELRNNVFSGQAIAAVACGGATFAARDGQVLHQNAANGACVTGFADTLTSDPQFLFAPAGDYRLGRGSAAVDSAVDLGLFLLPQYPATGPQHLGAGPDRGGVESW